MFRSIWGNLSKKAHAKVNYMTQFSSNLTENISKGS
jgi:hypothetical protein